MTKYSFVQIVSPLLVVIPFEVSCSATNDLEIGSTAGSSEPAPAKGAPQALTSQVATSTQRLNVRAGEANYVEIKAMPNSECILHTEGTTSTGQMLTLATDDDGIASYHITPDSPGVVTNDILDCRSSNGQAASYRVEIQATSDAPITRAPKPKGRIRPALTGNPMALTQDELRARGYPTRPDPVQAPDCYETWLKHVSQPMVDVTKPPRVSKERRNVSYTANWAGYAIQPSSGSAYLATTANWTIRTSSPEHSGTTDSAVFWVSVGGYGNNGGGMWQGGSEDDVYWASGSAHSSKYPWVEFINASGPCCPLQYWYGLPMVANDQFVFEVEYADVNRNPGFTGSDSTQELWYFFQDTTQGWYIGWSYLNVAQVISTYRANSGYTGSIASGITGGSAEWVVERPLINNNPITYSILPNFGTAQMTNAVAFDRSSWTWKSYAVQNKTQLYMGTSSHLLATSSAGSGGAVNFAWRNYN